MTEIGELEFTIYDEWGRGIPIPNAVQDIMVQGLSMTMLMALIRDTIESVI